MKVYISADIEGVTGVTNWDETELYHAAHSAAAAQMTKDVVAACRAAISAGADEILLKDGHDSARNIIAEALPEDSAARENKSLYVPDCFIEQPEVGAPLTRAGTRHEAMVRMAVASRGSGDNTDTCRT